MANRSRLSTGQPTLIIRQAEVANLLPISACIDAMDCAMRCTSAGEISIPPRIIAPLIDESGYFALMPGSMSEPPVYGAKVVSLHPANPARGLPAIQGFVTLFDHETGTPVAIIAGAALTAIRTAAASALATRVLARKESRSHGIFGTGALARTHVDAIAAVRDLDQVVVWGRDPKKAGQFAAENAQRKGLRITATDDPAEAGACEIVSAVTGAAEPILKGEWLKPGCHINLVGAHTPTTREADSDVMARSRIYVDLMESALTEAGDLLIPMKEGRIAQEDVVAEIGEVLLQRAPGRTNCEQITLYKSLGIVAQDLFAAERVYRAAVEQGVGLSVALE